MGTDAETHSQTLCGDESKMEVPIKVVFSELRESHGKFGAKIVRDRGGGGHQENTAL